VDTQDVLILEGAEAQHFISESFVYIWPLAVAWESPDHDFAIEVRYLPRDTAKAQTEAPFDPFVVVRQELNPDGSVAGVRVGIRKIVRRREKVIDREVDLIDAVQCGLAVRTAFELASRWGLPE